MSSSESNRNKFPAIGCTRSKVKETISEDTENNIKSESYHDLKGIRIRHLQMTTVPWHEETCIFISTVLSNIYLHTLLFECHSTPVNLFFKLFRPQVVPPLFAITVTSMCILESIVTLNVLLWVARVWKFSSVTFFTASAYNDRADSSISAILYLR